MEFHGVYVPVVTPLDSDGKVDHATLGTLVKHVMRAGATGIVACGSTGEFYALSDEERLDVLRTVRDAAPSNARLVAGCNAGSTRDVIRNMVVAADLGFEAVMLAPPFYSLPSPDELIAHFRAAASAVDLPIILYNFPARTGVEISAEVLDGLRDVGTIVAIKESSGDLGRLHMILESYDDDCRLICGADDQAFDYGAWGVRGWIAGIANCVPAQCAAVLDAFDRGDLAAAREAMRRILPLAREAERGKFTQKVKYGCELIGLCSAKVRAPLYDLNDSERDAVGKALERAGMRPETESPALTAGN